MVIDIKQHMEQLGISRYELAKRIGVTYPTMDNIYKGTSTSIKFDILENICKELDCTPNDILIMNKQPHMLNKAKTFNEILKGDTK